MDLIEPGGRRTWGARRHELSELDRLLSLLARPARFGSRVPKALRFELLDLGVTSGLSACRRDLIEQVWERKRPLLRQLHHLDDPLPPVA